MDITYELRKLLQNKGVRSVVINLHRQRNEKSIELTLPIASSHFDQLLDMQEADRFEECTSFADYKFIGYLLKSKILSPMETKNDDFIPYTDVCVKINKTEFLGQLYEWVDCYDHILNYGIFSLNTLTGEAYCGDHKAKSRFDTFMRPFQVFRAFMKNENHEMSYEIIYQLATGKTMDKGQAQAADLSQIYQLIRDLRKKLRMKGELSKLFASTGTGYKLLQGEHFIS